MKHRIFIAGGDETSEVLRWSDDRLAQALRQGPESRSLLGGIYLGRVTRIEPGLNAAFVDIGIGKSGLLPLKKSGQRPTEGQSLIVQVRRDGWGEKGPRLSTTINADEPFEEKAADASAPACLVPPTKPWVPVMAALPPEDIVEIVCDRRVDAAAVAEWCRKHAADLADRVRFLPQRDWTPDRAALEDEIALALEEEVRLPSGGTLLIEPVRTLTAIDVNSAATTDRRSGIEQTALAVNLEAAVEIPRQLALRNLGGIVVIDFIDLENRNKRDQVLSKLRDAAAVDPAIAWIGNMSRLGLVEIMRKRQGPTLEEMWR